METREAIIKTLVLSIINYCSSIWGMANKTQINRVQKLQNYAAKVAHGGVRKYDHVTPVLEKLKWLKIEEKVQFDVAFLVFKVLNNYLLQWFYHFNSVSDMRRANTRQMNNLVIPRNRSNIGGQSFVVKGAYYLE